MKWGEHKNAWMMDMDGFCALQGMYCSYLMLFESIYNLFDSAEGDLPYVAKILVKTESLLICLPRLRKPGK